MPKHHPVIWLPTEDSWDGFIHRFGVPLDAPLADGDQRVLTHAEAMTAAVQVLIATGQSEPWLLLSTPRYARAAAPDADLASQAGRAEVATKIAEQVCEVLGVNVTERAVGWAVIRSAAIAECERRGPVRIFVAS